MGEATVYQVAVEAHYRFNNEFLRRVDALVTGRRSKCISAMHQFPPLHSIFFSNINASFLIKTNATVLMPTD